MILVFLLSLGLRAADGDRYDNYAELAAHEREGVDYRIEEDDRVSPITVLAIHGGLIEPGSTEMARLIARDGWNFYSFEGMKQGNNLVLHVTSTHFDEPRAMELAARSEKCVSMHGFFQEQGGPSIACVGGGNAPLARRVADALRAPGLGLRVEYPCERFPGRDPKNIVNRCREGVQVEMSPTLRQRVLRESELAERLAVAIRGAVQ